MVEERYFCETVGKNTFEYFITLDYKKEKEPHFQLIQGNGWKTRFGFNADGTAIYITEEACLHYGVWFLMGDKRIAVFETKGYML